MIINQRQASPVTSRDTWLHDFNNVLAAIRLQAVLGRIHAGDAAPDVLEALEEIEKNCERAVELLEKIPGKNAGISSGSPLAWRVANSGRGRVLLMDDNESLQISLYKILSGLGYEVILASGGADCIQRLRELHANGERADVCVLDLKVPGGMGGVETLAQLREIDPQLKAVASTGFSEADVINNHRNYGFQAALSKPFRIQQLVDLLDQLTKAPQGRCL